MVVIALAATFWLRVRERPFIEQSTLAVWILTALALVFWYIFLTSLRWKTRFLLAGATAVLIAGVIFGVRHLTRVEGSIGGSGMPRLVWKWSPRRDASAGQLLVSSNTPPAAVASASGADAPSFPQFLGPNRSGVLHGVSLARDWAASPPRQLWRRPVGPRRRLEAPRLPASAFRCAFNALTELAASGQREAPFLNHSRTRPAPGPVQPESP